MSYVGAIFHQKITKTKSRPDTNSFALSAALCYAFLDLHFHLRLRLRLRLVCSGTGNPDVFMATTEPHGIIEIELK